MILEKRTGQYLLWNSKCSKTKYSTGKLRLFFNKHSNELEFCDNHLLCEHYSIEEIEDMLRELKRVNKKGVLIK